MVSFLRVTEDETSEAVGIPSEEDGCILLSNLSAQFPGACGLRYRSRDSDDGSLRGVRLVDGKFYPPEGGWSDHVYICVFPRDAKRKNDDENYGPEPKKKSPTTTDLIVLGLAWKTTEEQMHDYFKGFGAVVMATVKKDPTTGKSKGFGFVKFEKYSDQLKVISQRHFIDGRWCDVKLPYSSGKDTSNNFIKQACKIFVGRIADDITAVDLKEYFSKFGDVAEVFIPMPFRKFAFITFSEPQVANMVWREGNHVINGVRVNVSEAAPDRHSQRLPDSKYLLRRNWCEVGERTYWSHYGSIPVSTIPQQYSQQPCLMSSSRPPGWPTNQVRDTNSVPLYSFGYHTH